MPSIIEWETELRLSSSPDTVRAYTGAMVVLLGHAGKCDADALTRADVLSWLGQPHLSSNSRAVYLRRVSAWARWAGRPDLVENVKVAAYRHPMKPPPTDAQVAAMRAACRGPEDRALIALLSGMGLRRSEAARVRGEDLDGGRLRVLGKGNRVDVLPYARTVLDAAQEMPASGYWFPGPDGGPLTPDGVARRVARIASDAGVGHVTPHQLRAWFATTLSRRGAQLAPVSRLMRHAQASTTMLYVRPDEGDLRAALDLLAA